MIRRYRDAPHSNSCQTAARHRCERAVSRVHAACVSARYADAGFRHTDRQSGLRKLPDSSANTLVHLWSSTDDGTDRLAAEAVAKAAEQSGHPVFE